MPVLHSLSFVPMAAEIPPSVDLDKVLAGVAKNHVYTTQKDEKQLAAVAARAHDRGLDLSIVVVPVDPGEEAQLRDLATTVGKRRHDTVVVLSPGNKTGTYSDSVTRVQLEAAEDAAKAQHGGPGHQLYVDKSQAFLDRVVIEPTVSWTAVSSVLLVGTALAVGGLYLVKVRRAAGQADSAAPVAAAAE